MAYLHQKGLPFFENAKRAAMFQIAVGRTARTFVIGFTLSLLLRWSGGYCGAIGGARLASETIEP
jgi:hypothetical protein